MFTRSELESKSRLELTILAGKYGIKPVGNPGYKNSWIVAILANTELACNQYEQGQGVKAPKFTLWDCIHQLVDEIGEPTDEQIALIKMMAEGKTPENKHHWKAERILTLWKIRRLLQRVENLIEL